MMIFLGGGAVQWCVSAVVTCLHDSALFKLERILCISLSIHSKISGQDNCFQMQILWVSVIVTLIWGKTSVIIDILQIRKALSFQIGLLKLQSSIDCRTEAVNNRI